VDFHSVRVAARQKLPFGIAQIGKAFRNEVNPRNFIFRSREFTQMEMEFFCDEEESMQWFDYWKEQRVKYYRDKLGFGDDFMRIYVHEKLAHYAKAAIDVEVKFPFGWGELEGVHHRGTWDMSQHQEFSGKEQHYMDHDNRRKVMPTVIETSVGLDRTFMALLCKAYDEEVITDAKDGKAADIRTVLHLPPLVAPIQVAVLPLSKKLSDEAKDLYNKLNRYFRSEFDVTGSIGKRYRRQDEIGTPFCITYDFDSQEDNAVTVRHRDSMEQERIAMSDLRDYLEKQIDPDSAL
jgi:glycyl-tRNA synthetase